MAERRDLPLIAWGEALRAARRRRTRLRRRAALLGAGVAALGHTIIFPPTPRLVWNASASAPIGLYWIDSGAAVAPGDLIATRLPEEAAALAARRRYLPRNVPAVKQIGAVAGDLVCARGRVLTVNGQAMVLRRERDRRGRPLPWWEGCRQLRPGELLLLNRARPDSFDGRYFGPSDARLVLGRATLLWPR
ncbi:S26 family signal peptidase [Sphingomonas cannabina]|uniref:S26 family signal peptidase n=1 Tax=Sphingomonas cannabina TaxID=2899123 RepID=UPI001F3A637A|nr:S26 family signal peptidase [Sphingomonas cannabina]UIJ44775.1 S26 family signal peptidase [Sphingomonas cannabina]